MVVLYLYMVIKKKLITAALVGTTLLAGFGIINVARRPIPQGQTVIEVIDGDTFFITNHQRVRINGLDAPEIQNCNGKEAKEALKKLVLNKKVILSNPVVDYYKRIVASVSVDGISVGEYLIKNGFAIYNSTGDTDEYLRSAGNFAREQKLGIFSSKCYQIDPPDPKCPIKGNIDHIKKTKSYYLPECKIYNEVEMEIYLGDEWFCSEKEAKSAGYTKAQTCL